MATAEISRRVEKVVGYPPLSETQEHNRQVLAHLKPHELARLETWLRTRTHATPPRPACLAPVDRACTT